MTKEELKLLVKKNPVSAGCVVLSVLLGLGLYFRAGEIPAAETELAQKSAEAERYELNIKNSVQLKEQLDEMIAARKGIDGRIVRVSQQGNNTQFFLKIFAETGVKQVDFRQTTTTAAAPKGGKNIFVPVVFAVSVQGSVTQILDFLRQLEGGAHFCRVLTASCGGNPANRKTPLTLSLNLELLGLP